MIESKIDELIAALNANADATRANTVALLSTAGRSAAPEAPKAEKPTKAPKADAPKEAPKEEPPKPAALDYEKDVRPKLYEVSRKKGADEARAVLAKFGAKLGTDLKPEQYADFVQMCADVLK